MSQVFEEEGTDGILLIDASNAFKQMNRSAASHSIQITSKEMAHYVINTYRSPSWPFICGGGETLSQEGTTQGDSLAMPWYSFNTARWLNRCGLQTTLLEEGESRSCTTDTSNWLKREKSLDISWTGQLASWLLSLRHLQMKQRGCLEMKSINNWRSAPSSSSHCVARIQRSILWGENSHMGRGNRTALKRVSLTQRTLSS